MRPIDADLLLFNLADTMAASPTGYIHGDEVANMIHYVPTVEPERKTGRWEEVKNSDGASHDYRCSSCHRYRFHNGEMRSKYKYCPNCGAKMEGGQE